MKLEVFIEFMCLKTAGVVDVKRIVHREKYGTYEYAGYEYLVLSEDEAHHLFKSRIKELLHEYRASYLAAETDLPEDGFKQLLKLHDGANDFIAGILESYAPGGFDGFAHRQAERHGRGKLLATYNHYEQQWDQYFFYRIS
jgi:hypothetical protein